MDVAMKFLLAHKDRLSARDYEDLIDIFGEQALENFTNGEGKLPIIKEQDDVNYIQNLYKKLNPIYPFGIMSILEWTFAYTGFIQCVENDGINWNTVPTAGPQFHTLQTRLTMESEGGNIVMASQQPKQPEKKKGLFGGLFG